ncbi:MAG TPA: protein kinase, partial [Actinoplanes sp.]
MSSDWPVASALMAGRYRLVSLLETGGMAEIWRAEDELLDRPVAVKLPTSPQVVWREARMAARLSHPGIAAVHDYREAVRPDGTVVPFVVMELLTGESVAARVDRELIGWAEAARIGAAVADALAAAHASGVVHRDIKPGNVMLTPNGVKILDFGISVAAGEPDDDDTGATFGTPAYVAPERLDGMPAEPATDVYGVGVLLFEMVTGDPPYPVETWEELAAARASGPSELPESLPPDFRDVVNRCLDADPAGRPTAARLRADLLAVALRSRPPAPAAGGEAQSAEVGDGPDAGEENGVPARRAEASGSIGNLVRAAGGPAGQWAAAAEPAGHVGAAADNQAGHVGAAGAPAGPAGEFETATATALDTTDDRRERPGSAGVGAAARTGSGAGRNTAGDDRFAGAAQAASSNRATPNGRPDNRAPRPGGGSPRSPFAYTDSDDARDWRPDGEDTSGGPRSGPPGSRWGPPGSRSGPPGSRWGPPGSRRSTGARRPTGSRRPTGARRPTEARNFATGRASAATLDMADSPRRRTIFGIGAAVVLAALAGAFALLTWTHRDSDHDVAVPPPATAPVLPRVTATTPNPAATSAAPTSAGPSPKASLTFADAVSRMRDAVEGGAASGQIRQDVAQDLLNLLGPLSNAQGSDLTGQVQA